MMFLYCEEHSVTGIGTFYCALLTLIVDDDACSIVAKICCEVGWPCNLSSKCAKMQPCPWGQTNVFTQ